MYLCILIFKIFSWCGVLFPTKQIHRLKCFSCRKREPYQPVHFILRVSWSRGGCFWVTQPGSSLHGNTEPERGAELSPRGCCKRCQQQEDKGCLRFVFLAKGSQAQLWKTHQDPSVVTSSAWQAARAKHGGCQNTVLFCEEHQVPAEEEIAGLLGV